MAIERAGMMGKSGMMDKAGIPPEASDSGETTTIPLSMLGGQTVAPGDVVRLEVVSLDDESGTITAKYSMPDKADETGGIDDMASKFGKG